jgi:hypothetical protein
MVGPSWLLPFNPNLVPGAGAAGEVAAGPEGVPAAGPLQPLYFIFVESPLTVGGAWYGNGINRRFGE